MYVPFARNSRSTLKGFPAKAPLKENDQCCFDVDQTKLTRA